MSKCFLGYILLLVTVVICLFVFLVVVPYCQRNTEIERWRYGFIRRHLEDKAFQQSSYWDNYQTSVERAMKDGKVTHGEYKSMGYAQDNWAEEISGAKYQEARDRVKKLINKDEGQD